MKQANDNQIEFLLRKLGERSREATRAAGSEQQLDHLDADEINAFAEGQVPERARSRYVAHIADCDSCRTLVASLVQTGAITPAPNVSSEPTPRFWAQVAAFLSPAVLRFAVPALVLAVVIGVSFFALRQRPTEEFVARQETSTAGENKVAELPVATTQPTASPAAPRLSEPSVVLSTTDKRAESTPTPPESGLLAGRSEQRLRDLNAAPVAGTSTTQPLNTLEPQAPPAPPKANAPVAQAEAQKEDAERSRGQRRDNAEFLARSKDEDAAADRAAPAPVAGGIASARKVEELPASRRAYEEKAKKNQPAESEVKTVAGRHFRREGSTWIDTAYSSGRSTIGVARGSEHYRTLIGDEPGLRTIAERLAGEVIVVWKGKAYRIR